MNFVVGVAVAGRGLENLKRFFNDVPHDIEMAFIVVAPIPRDRESKLAEIIQRISWLPVHKVDTPMEIAPGHIYVIAENTILTIEDNMLLPLMRPPENKLNIAIDTLFTALGQNFKERAIGIVLDGMGNAGVKGVTQIEDNNGYVIISEPGHGRESEMPRGVINNDEPDVVLPVDEIVPYLIKYKNQ